MLKKYLAFAAASMIGLAGVATAAETVAQSNTQEARQIRLAPKKASCRATCRI
ncbi:hypothetical protein J2T38_000834 [Neisseria perflava]|uniref:hypothetical protein n=1 Tax=Neisseria perflava TaxID=33053 RepID=UPI0020A13228|nr:hypothetical protein [Neisseria perflava]MCP1772020.1 hypothetical protein [Neisseria perflava]